MGAENQIHEPITLLQLLHHRRFLHHAAAQGDFHMGIFFLNGIQKSQPPVYLLVCIIPDRAGIVENKLRMLIFCHLISNFLQNTDKLLTVPGIHLTPERLSKRERATSVFPFKLPNPFPAFCHKVILTGRFFCRWFLRRVDRVKIYFIIHKTFPLLNFY